MLRRKTSGSVVCPSCGSLVGVNDERCYTCGRANPGMWGFAPALRHLRLRPRLRSARHWRLVRPVRVDSAGIGFQRPVDHGRRLQHSRAERACAAGVWRERRQSSLPAGMVVDGAECHLAARQFPPHPVQHDVGARHRSVDGRCHRPGPHHHHLRGGRRLRVPAQLCGVSYTFRRCRCCAGQT